MNQLMLTPVYQALVDGNAALVANELATAFDMEEEGVEERDLVTAVGFTDSEAGRVLLAVLDGARVLEWSRNKVLAGMSRFRNLSSDAARRVATILRLSQSDPDYAPFFGDERIPSLMESLGVEPDSDVEHPSVFARRLSENASETTPEDVHVVGALLFFLLKVNSNYIEEFAESIFIKALEAVARECQKKEGRGAAEKYLNGISKFAPGFYTYSPKGEKPASFQVRNLNSKRAAKIVSCVFGERITAEIIEETLKSYITLGRFKFTWSEVTSWEIEKISWDGEALRLTVEIIKRNTQGARRPIVQYVALKVEPTEVKRLRPGSKNPNDLVRIFGIKFVSSRRGEPTAQPRGARGLPPDDMIDPEGLEAPIPPIKKVKISDLGGGRASRRHWMDD